MMSVPVLSETDLATARACACVPLRISYDEYLAWDYQYGLTEWVNGEVIFPMPPHHMHQRVVEFLDRVLGLFVQIFRLGMVRVAPFSMRALPDGNAREPDLFFLAAEHMARLTERELKGPADLIVEVISADSIGRDRADKFYEYQEAGVREYWIIDPRPDKQRTDFYVLDAKGRYQPVPLDAGIYRSTALPNFWLNEDWLWADELNALAALAEIVGIERMIAALQDTAPGR
jgi:Uma2 family endonuclease